MQTLKLDVNKRKNLFENHIVGRLGDQNLLTIKVEITDGDVAYPLAGTQISFKGLNSKNERVSVPVTGTISGNSFEYTFTGIEFSREGDYHAAYFEIKKSDSQIISTEDFRLTVKKDADISEGDAQPYISELGEQVELAKGYVQGVEDTAAVEITKIKAVLPTVEGQVSELKDELTDADQRLDEIEQKIADDDLLTVPAQVDYWAGKPVAVNGVASFVGKTAGDFAGNPHLASFRAGQTLYNPAAFVADNYITYPNIAELDSVINTSSNGTSGNMAQVLFGWNLIEQINRDHPKLFESLGATTLSAKYAVAQKIITSLKPSTWGYGSSPAGNKLTSVVWNRGKSIWESVAVNTTNSVKELTRNNWGNAFYLNPDGYVYIMVYAEPSDGTTASTVRIDYAQLAYKLDLSMYEFVPAKKDIYDKTQADQRFISMSENQTVGGVKNFLQPPQVQGVVMPAPTVIQTMRGELVGNVNFDAITEYGIRYVADTSTMQNAPSVGGRWGFLEVYPHVNGDTIQRFNTTVGQVFQRVYAGAAPKSWSKWQFIGGTPIKLPMQIVLSDWTIQADYTQLVGNQLHVAFQFSTTRDQAAGSYFPFKLNSAVDALGFAYGVGQGSGQNRFLYQVYSTGATNKNLINLQKLGVAASDGIWNAGGWFAIGCEVPVELI